MRKQRTGPGPAAVADRRYCDFVIDYRLVLKDYDEGLRRAYGGS